MVPMSFLATSPHWNGAVARLMRGMSFASQMCIIAQLKHSIVDSNLHIPANAAAFRILLVLGWLSLNLNRRTEIKNEPR